MNNDEAFRRMRYELDAIQAGLGPKMVMEDHGYWATLHFDTSKMQEYVERKEKQWKWKNQTFSQKIKSIALTPIKMLASCIHSPAATKIADKI